MWQSEALELSGPSRRYVVGEGVCRMGEESGGQGKRGSVCRGARELRSRPLSGTCALVSRKRYTCKEKHLMEKTAVRAGISLRLLPQRDRAWLFIPITSKDFFFLITQTCNCKAHAIHIAPSLIIVTTTFQHAFLIVGRGCDLSSVS